MKVVNCFIGKQMVGTGLWWENWPMTHKKWHYWNVLALTQRIRRCLKQHKSDLPLKVVFSAVAQPSSPGPGPKAGFTFAPLLRVVEHIPDDYRNSASTFMIVIIMRPLHPCSYPSWENMMVYCNLREENRWYIHIRNTKSHSHCVKTFHCQGQ